MTMLPSWATAALAVLFFASQAFASLADWHGRVYLPPAATPAQRASVHVQLLSDQGERLRSYCTADGRFAFHALPKGSYLVNIHVMGFVYPEYRLDVVPGFDDPTNVFLLSSKMPVDRPVVLMPVGEATYYHKRKPLDVKGLIMSPYGIMIAVALFAIFGAPSMKIDPEEMKQMQAEMKDTPLGFLVGGGGANAAGGAGGAAAAGSTAAHSASTTTTGKKGAGASGGGGSKKKK